MRLRLQGTGEAVLKTLVINADDFGLSRGINDAILDAVRLGCVTSASLMVNAPATGHAVDAARSSPALGVGLHFNITWGLPLSPAEKVPTLVDSTGVFHTRAGLARRLLLGLVERRELDLELRAQYERMGDHGLRPTHIDSHQHIHAFPGCFDPVAALCEARRIPLRMPWVLTPANVRPPVARRARQWILRRMLSRNRRRWEGRVRWNAGLGSIFDLGTVPQTLEARHYRALLQAAPPGCFELMVHPARDAAELDGLTRIGRVSESEWRFLTSGQLLPVLSELGFTLGSYRDV